MSLDRTTSSIDSKQNNNEKQILAIASKIDVLATQNRDEIKLLIAVAILEAMTNMQQGEFPNYIDFILNTPDFHLLAFSNLLPQASNIRGKYVGETHTLGLAIPENELSRLELVNNIIPHEFWHAYQTSLRVKDHNPKLALASKSHAELAKAQAPFSNKVERDELKKAITAGENRIVDEYKKLYDKSLENKLTTEEKLLFSTYNEAAADYHPRKYSYTLPIAKEEQEKFKTDLKMGRGYVVIGTLNQILYPDTCTPSAKGLTFHGSLAHHSANKAVGLIEDTRYRMSSKTIDYYKQTLLGDGDAESTYLTEADADIAVHSKKLNQTFYQERSQYHQQILMRHLASNCLSCAPHFSLFARKEEKDSPKEVSREEIITTLNQISRHLVSDEIAWHFDSKHQCAWTQSSRANLEKIYGCLSRQGINSRDMKIANSIKERIPTFKLAKIEYSRLKHIEDGFKNSSLKPY